MMKEFGNKEEVLILECIRKGDAKAFERLFKLYYPELCSYLRTMIKERELIEEIVQGLFVYLWENRSTWYSKGSIKSYLYKSVRNRAINHFKRNSIRDKYSEEIKLIYFSEINSVDKLYDAEELKQIISNLVALLPDKCREIFMLVKFHALTYRETAEILDLSIKTVETQMGRALKKLKESLLIYYN